MKKYEKTLRLASIILTVTAIGMAAASIAILSDELDPNTRTGRHLVAGALANLSLSAVELFIALFPIRKGERWGVWAFALPLLCYGIPILMLDATYVARERHLATLGPQIGGLILGLTGLIICVKGIVGKQAERQC